MRKISIERIGEYLKTALEIIHENGDQITPRLLIMEMTKRLKPDEYELSLTKKGGVRWVIKFKFFSIGLGKGEYIKKLNRVWYLTSKGLALLNKPPIELVTITNECYEEWVRRGGGDEQEVESATSLEEIEPLNITNSKMQINPLPIDFEELIRGVERCEIQIPPFQRDFVWSAKAIDELLYSIYNGYPIGSFIFWKTKRRLPRHRQIGGIDLNINLPEGSLIDYVLDGQQRVTSLYAAVKNGEIEKFHFKFYFDLSTGKFVHARIEEDEDDLADDEKKMNDLSLVPLEKLFVDRSEYFHYIDGFPQQHKPVLNDLYNRFKDYAFSVVYVQNKEESAIVDVKNKKDIETIVKIFTRINNTGKKLTVISLMIAKCWEKDFDLRRKLNEVLPENSNLSEINEEIVLQAASVIINNKKCRTKNILDDTNINELNEKWDAIASSFNLSLDFLKDKIGIRNFKYLPFGGILVPLTYFHYKEHNPSGVQSERLSMWFWKLCLSNRYGSTVEAKIEEDCKLMDKIVNNEESELNYSIDWTSFNFSLINQNYNLGNAFCKTVLCLYSNKKPRSLNDNREVDLINNFSNYSRKNFHHFFPKGYLKKIDDPRANLRDSVVNIAFLPAVLNWEISDDPPSEYIKRLGGENPLIEESLKSHLIGGLQSFGLNDDDFDKFLRMRSLKIENEFRSLVGMQTITETQLADDNFSAIDFLENKFRNFLDKKLTEEYGENYWEESVPEDIRIVADKKIEGDVRLHPYNEPLYVKCINRLSFLDVMDYYKMLMVNWNLFADIFNSKTVLEKHFLDLKNFRNSVKHNRAIDVVERKNGEAAILWFEKIFENLN